MLRPDIFQPLASGANLHVLQRRGGVEITIMTTDIPPDDPQLVLARQGNTQESAYVEGVATGCFGCFGSVVLAIIGFVAGCTLISVAHEQEWFYTQEEFKNRHGSSDAGLMLWSNVMTGGLVGAELLPIAGVATYAFLRSGRNHGRE
jgi:hypothetical protein